MHQPVGCLTDTPVERAQVTPGRINQPSDSFEHPASKCFPTYYDSKTSRGFGQPQLLLTASAACLSMAEEIEAVLTMRPSVHLNNQQTYI